MDKKQSPEELFEQICLFCEHFKFYPGCHGYSEMTPGYGATIRCDKGCWKVDLYKDSRETYRNKMLMAKTCKDYQQVVLED